MATATYTGTLADAGLNPITASAPQLTFRLENEATSGRYLVVRKPVPATILYDGTFFVALQPSDELLGEGNGRYIARAEWLDPIQGYSSMDLFTFFARAGGGEIAGMRDDLATWNPAQVFWQGSEPSPWPVGWVWVNTTTGDAKRMNMNNQIEYLGNIVGPEGPEGPGGPRGLDGVNAVANDTAAAGYVENPTSDTRGALDELFAKPAIPANVLALTRDGTHNQNAATVLQPWYAALANRDNTTAKVAVIGDSIVEGYGATAIEKRWVTKLAANLRNKFPVAGSPGGRGYIGAKYTGDFASFTWPCTLSAGVTVGSTDYGLKRSVVDIAGGKTATFALKGSYAWIMYPTAPTFTSFTYSLDGGAAVTVSQTSATAKDGVVTGISLGSSGAHTLVLTGGTSSFIDGVIECDGDQATGITVHDGGHSGWRSDQWAAGSANTVSNWPAAYKTVEPQVFILALGVNDQAQDKTAAEYKAAMTNLLTIVRSFASWQPIVLMPYGASGDRTASWQGFVTAMYELAATDGNTLVADMTLRVHAKDGDTTDVWFDGNHPNNKGHAMYADFMANFLSPS
ncbi:hypothetical protein PA27867_3631 [Cryobacterium arcticum]|uniref:SGNH hydrolase-type esterase domain-containing protein n=2 Tax=Cryobacterium arcticum TaxID=670052 RepID=A0A1B1BPJ2_9MICO|nr:hypothetical protein PA27867_3631 [Cryobacterium arcticum]